MNFVATLLQNHPNKTQRANPIGLALPRLRLAALLFIRLAGRVYDGPCFIMFR